MVVSQQRVALSRLFSPTVLRELATRGRSPSFARLYGLSGLATTAERPATVASGFERAFATLRETSLRDEYVYRAAITKNVLLGKHSLNTASMLSEFRVADSKADVVILNSTASVYEIKTERDTLTRLTRQLANYRKMFATVNVIAGEGHLSPILKLVPDDVGVLCLNSRLQIHPVRAAKDQPERIDPVVLFESLRLAEATAVLRILGKPVPELPNTKRHAALSKIFATLEPAALHQAMLSTLKHTRDLRPLASFIHNLPASLHPLALASRLTRREQARLSTALSTPMTIATNWA